LHWAGLVLAAKLKLVEDIIELFKAFDLPCNTDLECLIFSCFNTIDKVELFRKIVTRLFLDGTIILYQVMMWGEAVGDRHFHKVKLYLANWIGSTIIILGDKSHAVSVVQTRWGIC
jgi:hypothetical protein